MSAETGPRQPLSYDGSLREISTLSPSFHRQTIRRDSGRHTLATGNNARISPAIEAVRKTRQSLAITDGILYSASNCCDVVKKEWLNIVS